MAGRTTDASGKTVVAAAGSAASRMIPGRSRDTERASRRDGPDAGGIRRRLQGGAARGRETTRRGDGTGPVGSTDKPPTQPNLRLLPAFPCETAPMTPVPGADATTRGLPSPMSAGHAMGRPPRNQSVLLTCSKYVPMQQKLA